jgi:TetR/AcrR family transcriptional regulator, transcriptional repressor for nem operon
MLTKSDRTRQHIIEKAAHLFNTKGYAATSMSDIITATGLAKGGIYGNFKSKEEIAVQAFEYAFKKVMDEMTFKIKAQATYTTKLYAILDFHKNYSDSSPIAGGCPLLNFSCDADDTNPALRKRVKESMDAMLNALIYIIEQGKKKGEFHKQVNAEETADIIFSQIEGGIMMSKTYNDSRKLNRLLDNLRNYIKMEMSV